MSRSVVWVIEAMAGLHGNSKRLGHQLVQELQAFGHNFSRDEINASRIAARPGETSDQTQLDRVFANAKDDRDRRGRSFGRKRTTSVGRGDHGHATADQIGNERRPAVELALQPMVLDHHVLALNVAGFVEAFAERSDSAHGSLGRQAADEADDRHRRLLRARRERPRGSRAAQQRDELAPSHVLPECHTLPHH
jgi:hypothetical protein